MKKTLFSLLFVATIFSCDNFLEESNPIGLTADKITDISSMQALVNGSFANLRGFTAYQNMIASTINHDVLIRRNPNWIPYFYWSNVGLSNIFTSNMYFEGYKTLNKLNTIANANVSEMYGSDAQKNGILGDMHFLRALVYFDMNNYFTLYSSGKTVPLVLNVLGINDRVSVAKSSDVQAQIELDIEMARNYFRSASGVSNYEAATALAARIYFYHKKYDLAYQRANEVIESSTYSLESDVSAPFTTGSGSSEVIFAIKYNASEGWSGAAQINFDNFQPDKDRGITSLNPESLVAQLRAADPDDKRHSELYTEADGLVYANGKFPSNKTDYIYLRYSEILLTRAEANIMKNNVVRSQDVADINTVKNRANANDVIMGIPNVTDALEALFNERSKELCFEHGDRFLNTRRLEKGIINESGTGEILYSEYVNQLVFPFPLTEIQIHDLVR
jgi:starch-binding outer membrane protein, SusD/RagB family